MGELFLHYAEALVEKRRGLCSLLSGFGAYEGETQACLVAFRAIRVGDFIGSEKTYGAGGKILAVGEEGRPHFALTVLYGYFKKLRRFWIAFCGFRHIILLLGLMVFHYKYRRVSLQ
jgi:hypothetical protein